MKTAISCSSATPRASARPGPGARRGVVLVGGEAVAREVLSGRDLGAAALLLGAQVALLALHRGLLRLLHLALSLQDAGPALACHGVALGLWSAPGRGRCGTRAVYHPGGRAACVSRVDNHAPRCRMRREALVAVAVPVAVAAATAPAAPAAARAAEAAAAPAAAAARAAAPAAGTAAAALDRLVHADRAP